MGNRGPCGGAAEGIWQLAGVKHSAKTLPQDPGDEDGDGAANLLERATGSDPLVAGPHPGDLVKTGSDPVMILS